jgi:hypothetical protein
MFKFIFILTLGVAIGYGYGWKDAHQNERHVAERLLDGVGGQSRKLVASDVDQTMNDVEKR